MSEITAWLAYCFLIGGALTGGAWVWERSCRWSGGPARWGWVLALAGSVTLPFVLKLVPQPVWPEAVPMVGMVGVVTLEALTVSARSTPGAVTLEAVAIGVWVVLSLAVLLYAYGVVARVAESRRRWRSREVDGERVLVSRDVGPAALGVRRAVVVVPSWALELEADLRRLMLLHEREHVRAGDPRLLLASLMLVALMPWNPVLWFQAARLRNAIELDCDGRVLRHRVDPARYGALLLEVGRRRAVNPLVFATFAEPRVFLTERIRRIARWPLDRRPLRAAALSLVALLLFTTALLARVQSVSVLPAAAETRVLEVLGLPGVQQELRLRPVMVSDTPPAVRIEPRHTQYTLAPQLRNSEDIMERMAQLYPPLLRNAGIGGTATLWVYVNRTGGAQLVEVARSSGHQALDEAALKVAESMRFVPAQYGTDVVPAWIQVPVTFGELAHSVTVDERPTVVTQTLRVSDVPHFTPMTKRPELLNPAEVSRALVQHYPPELRDAGIGGTAVLWFYIDENGSVLKTQLKGSSGHQALDDAAARVAGSMQFAPALNRDRKVGVWIEIPVAFTSKSPEEVAVRESQVRLPLLRSPAEEYRIEASALRRAYEVEMVSAARRERQRIPLTREYDLVTNGPAAPARGAVRAREEETSRRAAQPELRNAREVEQALVRSYPPLLRDAGIGGAVMARLLIDGRGEVSRIELHTSSGYEALDRAALTVAATMRFAPRGGDVETWHDIPIVFTAK